MKYLIIPDLHGRHEMLDSVKDFLEKDITLRGIFMGDIFDSFDRTMEDQVKCFDLLLELKHKFEDRFIWLAGNHDTHYYHINNVEIRGSGFQDFKGFMFQHLLKSVENKIQFVHIDGTTVFSHAGITKHFLNENRYCNEITDLPYFTLNNVFSEMFWCGPEKNGPHLFSGPTWTGALFLKNNAVEGYNQIVGHTFSQEIIETITSFGDKIMYTDCGKISFVEI